MSGISQLQALSPVGRCKTFDASGDGYGRGEGCAVAVLARNSCDGGAEVNAPPLALVRSTTVNQDGRSSSLTAPNGPSQTALVAAALSRIGALPQEVAFVAVHGTGVKRIQVVVLFVHIVAKQQVFGLPYPATETLPFPIMLKGTPLGDPIEMGALGTALSCK